MARADEDWVWDILSAIAGIRADTAGMDFAATSAIVRSVLYFIAVMGEAAKGIGPAFKASYPDMRWRAIAGIRDRIVHEYFRTNTRRIWDVVVTDIDDLERALKQPGNGRTGGRR